ncbi:MAG TPA: hypothetical protein VGR21_02890, partial [Cryptosporangiaceae bacterium]|nr:hypothetical protein [Cryptosporangiaceae bacterium]
VPSASATPTGPTTPDRIGAGTPRRPAPPPARPPGPPAAEPAARVSAAVENISAQCDGSWDARFTVTVTGHPVRYVNLTYWWPGQPAITYGTAPIGNGQYIVKPENLPFDTTVTYRGDVVRTDGQQVSSPARTVYQPRC